MTSLALRVGAQITAQNILIGVGALAAISGVSAGAGIALQTCGKYITDNYGAFGNTARITTLAGDKLFALGKGGFLSIFVPVYTVTWVVPKWIVTKAIPKTAEFLNERALQPIWRQIISISQFAYRILGTFGNWTYNHILQPAAIGLANLAAEVWQVTKNIFIALYQNVLLPIDRFICTCANWTLNRVIVPTINVTRNAFDALVTRVLQPLGRAIKAALVWTWDAVIQPIGTAISNAIQSIYTNVVRPLANLTRRAAVWIWQATCNFFNSIYQNILVPLGQIVSSSVRWVWNQVIVPTGKSIQKVFKGIFTHILKPIGNAIYNTVQAIYTNVVKPPLDLTKRAALWLWHTVILPVGQGVLKVAQVASTIIYEAGQVIANSTIQAAQAVRNSAQWVADRFA